MEKIVLILVMVSLIGSVVIFRENWVSPAGINILENCFFIFFAVIIFGGNLEWRFGGIYWVLMSCFLFLIGQKTGKKLFIKNRSKVQLPQKREITNVAYLVLFLVTIICFWLPIMSITGAGYSIRDVLNLHKLLEINNTIAKARYGLEGTEIVLGTFGSILTVLSYFVSLVGGYLYIYAFKVREKIVCISSVFPIIANMMITNAKSGLIAGVMLWASGYLVAALCKNGEREILSARLVKWGILVGSVCFILLYLVMMMRIGEISKATQEIVADKFQAYAFGHVYSFDYWFWRGNDAIYDLGSNTFMFFTNWLGLSERVQGVYSEILTGVSSNIYTQYRGNIADFGKLGGLLWWYLYGGVTGVLWKQVKFSGTNNKAFSKVLLGSVYFSIFYGFLVSPWIYSSYVLAYVLFLLALLSIKFFPVNIGGAR